MEQNNVTLKEVSRYMLEIVELYNKGRLLFGDDTICLWNLSVSLLDDATADIVTEYEGHITLEMKKEAPETSIDAFLKFTDELTSTEEKVRRLAKSGDDIYYKNVTEVFDIPEIYKADTGRTVNITYNSSVEDYPYTVYVFTYEQGGSSFTACDSEDVIRILKTCEKNDIAFLKRVNNLIGDDYECENNIDDSVE